MIYPVAYFLYLLVVWSVYRFVFHQTEMVDEVLVKPIVWLTPLLLFFLPKSRLSWKDLGLKRDGLVQSFFLSLGLGFVFLLVSIYGNYQKYGGRLVFSANTGTDNLWALILLVLVTSLVEESVFRGYFFRSLKQSMADWMAGGLAILFWVLVHLPIVIFSLNLTEGAFIYLGLTAVYGAGALAVYSVTGNLLAPVLLHLMWSLPIILFR